LHVSEMRDEMMSYKKELTSATGQLDHLTSLDDLQDEINDIKKEVSVDTDKETPPKLAPEEPEVVTFKKKAKKNEAKTEISDTDV
ncbi:MAG: hypothetical protein U9R50_05140, partial [Campylobacterota bacterium]|nr:hypothetical protein [Campylobacterota bacterium]